jgi:hypothetical protein
LGKQAENAKKMLFGGNEANNTLKTQHLTFSGTQNELLFELRNLRSNPKIGLKIGFSGVRGPNQDSGARVQG